MMGHSIKRDPLYTFFPVAYNSNFPEKLRATEAFTSTSEDAVLNEVSAYTQLLTWVTYASPC